MDDGSDQDASSRPGAGALILASGLLAGLVVAGQRIAVYLSAG